MKLVYRQVRYGLVAALFALPALAYAAGVAMVTDLQGKASATGDGRLKDVTILSEIDAGAQVQLAAGGALVAMYLSSGAEYAFKGPATIVFKGDQPDVTSGAKPEKRNAALGKGNVKIKPVGVAQGAMVMRGFRTGARIQLLSLHKTKTLDTQPEFRWQAIQPGVKYHLEISDDTGRTLHEADVDDVVYRLPAGVALKEGVTYTWEVSARLPDGRKYSSSADFAVAPADLRAQAEIGRAHV